MLLLGRKGREKENDCLKRGLKLESEAIIQFFLGDSELIPLLYNGHTSPAEMKHIHPFSLTQDG